MEAILISYKTRQVIFWILSIIGMVLHFNYNVSDIFYGIDVKTQNANGFEPSSLLLIRTIFYHLPFFWIMMIVYTNKKWVDLLLLIISLAYLIAHGFHFLGEVLKQHKNYSQITLLFIVFLVVAILVFEHYKLYKTYIKKEKVN